ncbi:MerR family transcriptional regulator [Sporosarcina sp. FSL K6-2383]|uniref:MerR family transcriptional regulator n=1 Tax=Sporosarcina sp. FSL K6-2383 TaxID=2921556 RepID=UPI00315A8D82
MMTYLSTGELSKRLKVSVRTLRYYDQIGLVQPSKKGEGGKRFYSPEDILALEKILLLKSLSLSLEDSKKIVTEKSITSILLVHKSLLEEQVDSIQKSIQHTTSLLNILKLEGTINWEDLLSLVVHQEHERDWQQYFTEDEKQLLREQLPKLENDDSTTKKWVNIMKRIEMCMDREVSPQSVDMQLIMEDITILSEETFQGDQQLMDKFWEVRKSEKASADLRLYPIKPAIIEYIEQALQVEK